MSLKLTQLELNADERAAIVGQTGTGKSYLAKFLLPREGKLAIIDPKRMFDFKSLDNTIKVFTSAKAIRLWKPDRFIFRPNPDELRNLSAYDDVYRYCYDRKGFFVYTDDVVGIMDRTRYPSGLQVDYQMGRELSVSCLSAFQRPSWLPMFLMSEASKFFVFKLNMKADIDRVSQFVKGYDPTKLPSKHHFFFQDVYTMEQAEIGIMPALPELLLKK